MKYYGEIKDEWDIATKGYVDNATANTSGAMKVSYTAMLATEWVGDNSPYTQEISLRGILATDEPHISPIYSNDNDMAIVEKEAWNMISKAVTNAGKITFTCFEDKPNAAININIEIIR